MNKTQNTKNAIPKKSANISEWYNRVVYEAGLADYGPAKGTMIFKPYGYAIWENVQKDMDKEIKAHGVDNAYFPLFIPESLLKKEKDHLEGFSPELAVVTIGGDEELEEKLIVRPTSETIMYNEYAKWVHSWRDLPILINQWNNVVRWEKRTYMFLRTTEFLWQEGHCAHATHAENMETVMWAITIYTKTYRQNYALAGYVGKKSKAEKFAGADETLTYEMLMPDGRALQGCTSHDLGQNFSKPFEIAFQDQNGEKQYAWQNSWGFSTRSIGGLILAHGDNNGLKLPPKIAPVQVIIIPVSKDEAVIGYCEKLHKELIDAGIRSKVDTRDYETFGYKINDWELKGVPVRLEIGKKEMDANKVSFARRDTGEKGQMETAHVAKELKALMEEIQAAMLNQSDQYLKENTREATSYDEFKNIMETTRGFIKAFWCEDSACEKTIKEETKATTRCLPLDAQEEHGKCVYCGNEASHKWLFAQAY